jgi:hypothetical protein
METPILAGLPIRSETIAQWHYTPDEWRKFGSYEGRHFQKMIRQTRAAFFVFLTLTTIALLAVPLFGVLRLAPWNRGMVGAIFLILLFGGGLIGIAAFVWMMQRSKLSTLMVDTAEVIITLTGISTSGIWHHWNYDTALGRRFHDARTMTVKQGKPDEMELLEVRTIANTPTGKVSHEVISSCRIPIPAGKKREAEEIVARILAEKSRSSLQN